jgi:hypothetical protein
MTALAYSAALAACRLKSRAASVPPGAAHAPAEASVDRASRAFRRSLADTPAAEGVRVSRGLEMSVSSGGAAQRGGGKGASAMALQWPMAGGRTYSQGGFDAEALRLRGAGATGEGVGLQ